MTVRRTIEFSHKIFDRVLVLHRKDPSFGKVLMLDLTRYQPMPDAEQGEVIVRVDSVVQRRRVPLQWVVFVSRKGQIVWPDRTKESACAPEFRNTVASFERKLQKARSIVRKDSSNV